MKLSEFLFGLPFISLLRRHIRKMNYSLVVLAITINLMLLFGVEVTSFDSDYNVLLSVCVCVCVCVCACVF